MRSKEETAKKAGTVSRRKTPEKKTSEKTASEKKAPEKKTKTVRRKTKKNDVLYYEVLGIVLLSCGLFVCVSLLTDETGLFGETVADLFHLLFGITALVPALFLAFLGARYMLRGKGFHLTKSWVLLGILYILALGWMHHFVMPQGNGPVPFQPDWAGLIGAAVATGLHMCVGSFGAMIALAAFTACDLLLLTHWHISGGARKIEEKTGSGVRKVSQTIRQKKTEWQEKNQESQPEAMPTSEVGLPDDFLYKKAENAEPAETEIFESAETEEPAPNFPEETPYDEAEIAEPVSEENIPDEEPAEEPAEEPQEADDTNETEEPGYVFPPLSLLHRGKGAQGGAGTETAHNAEILETTFKSFGVGVKVTNVTVGPTVTQYEIEPAMGVKVSRILSLQNDIAMALAATNIRIEAPIPGKSAVGIEVPNGKPMEVPLGDVIDTDAFRKVKGGVPVALGKDITGRPVIADLTKMPHLLIAGSTGSGKSVCINTIITSILYHSDPEDVKLILVDPKVVELSVYNGIPHLRIPVVTEPKRAAGALHWAVQEMENRYRQFSLDHVREIKGYNEMNPEHPLPYIVIIIDELADLMMVAKEGVETAICRLAQKARAAGIHMVLATQRPSTNVITGTIKANIPSRISFAVSSQIDSRVILDMSGAEKLVGKGDMLFNPIGSPNPVRVQGAFISDEEVAEVTGFIKEGIKETVEYEAINLTMPEEEHHAEEAAEDQDELLWEAAEWILDTKKASVSMLQRRFRIGYTRAGRLMDTLERLGIVGPADGARPREILITKEEFGEKFHGDE